VQKVQRVGPATEESLSGAQEVTALAQAEGTSSNE
jgi:hypothetical protein